MNKTTRYAIVFGIIAILVALFVWYKTAPGPQDKLANCLKEVGVKFYGAFWCPHCQATKAQFGKSAKLLPYIECSTPDSKGQLQICIDNKIVGYPTWEFPKTITIAKGDTDKTTQCKTPYTSDQPQNCDGALEGSWLTTIGGRDFLSPTKPADDGTNWTLPALTRTSGELPLETIASLAQCPVK
jgi:thiol-disulfide isomerase/thioredoxin